MAGGGVGYVGPMPCRNIAVDLGSKSDLPHCLPGLEYLRTQQTLGHCKVDESGAIIGSIHRHHGIISGQTLPYLIEAKVDVIIAYAGKAAHLPGMLDAILRNDYHDEHTVVFGVAGVGNGEEFLLGFDIDTLAAQLSICRVPGTNVVFDRERSGSDAFLHACRMAVEMPELPTIKRGKIPDYMAMSLDQMIELAHAEADAAKAKAEAAAEANRIAAAQLA